MSATKKNTAQNAPDCGPCLHCLAGTRAPVALSAAALSDVSAYIRAGWSGPVFLVRVADFAGWADGARPC